MGTSVANGTSELYCAITDCTMVSVGVEFPEAGRLILQQMSEPQPTSVRISIRKRALRPVRLSGVLLRWFFGSGHESHGVGHRVILRINRAEPFAQPVHMDAISDFEDVRHVVAD